MLMREFESDSWADAIYAENASAHARLYNQIQNVTWSFFWCNIRNNFITTVVPKRSCHVTLVFVYINMCVDDA